MEFSEYFQSYNDYFWHWEDYSEVVAIPGGSTIAYREFIIELLGKLVPQGFPPFGSLLLALIATNPDGKKNIELLEEKIRQGLDMPGGLLKDAVAFLRTLSDVPGYYKEGSQRVLLLQTIFEDCHNAIAAKKAHSIYDGYITCRRKIQVIFTKQEFSKANLFRDIKTIALLHYKFDHAGAILKKIASLPALPEEELLPEIPAEENAGKDFIEQLVENSKTFHAGSLVRHIWGGLNIPVHSTLPSQQPFGGVSDLTNKGEFDRLLISEFANDDLVFLSRLANNEALYIHREIPPADNNLQRIILVDVTLKNWGTPKTIAFAIMLAIARHPKTNIACTAFIVGNTYRPVNIESVTGIIDGLQEPDGSLHAAGGLEAFFKEHPANAHAEIFVISTASALKQAAVLKVMTEYHARISYWIYTDAEGGVDVYKKQQNGKRPLQHLPLPLTDIWEKEPRVVPSALVQKSMNPEYPILFRGVQDSGFYLPAKDGQLFRVTKEKALLRLYDKSASRPGDKGWDMVWEHLPFTAGPMEIGIAANGNYVLLMFHAQYREIILLDITTGKRTSVFFNAWKKSVYSKFIFANGGFYYLVPGAYWKITTDGIITQHEREKEALLEQYRARDAEREKAAQQNTHNYNILKNVQQVSINQQDGLVLNTHALQLNSGRHLKLERTVFMVKKHTATRINDQMFAFADGSTVEINRSGMMILKSSNNNIPAVYLPLLLDAALGVATETVFAGNEYYHKEALFQVVLDDAGPNILHTVKCITVHTGKGLQDAKDIVEGAAMPVISSVSKNEAYKIIVALEKEGAKASMRPCNNWGRVFEQTNVSADSFYRYYIMPFIKHIQAHATER